MWCLNFVFNIIVFIVFIKIGYVFNIDHVLVIDQNIKIIIGLSYW